MSFFRFKQFTILQKNAAAKVGTDGVLLGAWASLPFQPQNILDIGTGTGLIALMLAQRYSNARIVGIEKDINAYKEALFNIENSPWKQRLKVEHQDFLNYNTQIKYDLIISNPPFYTDDYIAPNQQRHQARHESHLPFQDLIQKSSNILSAKGIFAIIIPYKEEVKLLRIAEKNGLYPNKICHVKGNAAAEYKRSLISFVHEHSIPEISNLIIEKERHQYTQAYINLTKEFYLKM